MIIINNNIKNKLQQITVIIIIIKMKIHFVIFLIIRTLNKSLVLNHPNLFKKGNTIWHHFKIYHNMRARIAI